MYKEWLGRILGEKIDWLILWIKDSKKRLIFSVLSLIVVFGLILPKIVIFMWGLDYLDLLGVIFSYIYSLTKTDFFGLITLTGFLVVFAGIWVIFRKLSRWIVDIRPDQNPDYWAYYKGSGWSLVKDDESWYKVLAVTNCHYPVILKFGTNWINYRLSFDVKIPLDVSERRRNFSFVVRAKDKSNAIFIQCKPDGKITPHFVSNGFFVVDDENSIEFLARYPIDEWFSVEVVVRGNKIEITMLGVTATYTIPSLRLAVSASMIKSVMQLSEVRKIDLTKSEVSDDSSGIQIPAYVLDFDYEKGTIGFREWGDEKALFRKIKVELLEPRGL